MNLETLELAEALYRDELSGEQRQELEVRLSSDEQFREDFNSALDIIRSMDLAGKKDFYDKVKSWDAESVSTGRSINLNFRPLHVFSAAAAAIVLALVGYWFFSASNDSILNEYYEPYPNIVKVRGGESGNNLEKAVSLYETGKYDEAEDALMKFHTEFPDNKVGHLYYALSLIETNKYLEANEEFKAILSSNADRNTKQVAEWYQAMNLFAQDKEDDAIELIRQISDNSKHSYNREAKSILKDL